MATRVSIPFSDHPSTFDPRKSGDILSCTAQFMLYEGLTSLTPTNDIALGVAKKIDCSEDGKIYTFHLRDCSWSNGAPVTANDFERSWKSQLSPTFPALYAHHFFSIVNAKKAKTGECSLDEVGIQAIDETTLKVTLNRPTPFFLKLIAFCPFFPYYLEESDTLVTNGPFCLTEEKLCDQLIFHANPHYWNREGVTIDQIDVAIVKDEMTALNLFEQGQLDYVGDPLIRLPLPALDSLSDHLKKTSIAATARCLFNTTHPLFSNEKVRLALAGTIDYEALVNYLKPLPVTLSKGIVPDILKTLSCQRNLPTFDECQVLLSEGLAELRIDQLGDITLTYATNELNQSVAQVLQNQWRTHLGLKVKLKALEFSSYLQAAKSRDFDILLGKWISVFGDPMSVLEPFKIGSDVINFCGWESETFKKALEQSTNELDPIKRLSHLNQAEQTINDEAPLFPLFHFDYLYTLSDTLSKPSSGFFISPIGSLHFHAPKGEQ